MFRLTIYILCFVTVSLSSTDSTSVAIMDFEAAGVSQGDALGITNKFRNEVFRLDVCKVIERERMNLVLSEQGFQASGCTSTECAVKAGSIVGVNRIIVGSVAKVGSLFSLNCRLIDVESGKVINDIEKDYSGPIEQLYLQVVKQSALELFKRGSPKDYDVEQKQVLRDDLLKGTSKYSR